MSPEVQRPGWEVGSPTLPWLRAQLSAASWWPHLNTATNRLASIHSLFLSPKLCLRDSSGLLKKVSAARLALTSLPESGIFSSHGGCPLAPGVLRSILGLLLVPGPGAYKPNVLFSRQSSVEAKSSDSGHGCFGSYPNPALSNCVIWSKFIKYLCLRFFNYRENNGTVRIK